MGNLDFVIILLLYCLAIRDLGDFWSRSNQVPWGSRSQTESDQWWKTFKVLSLLVNWNLNSERQCGLHFRNKRNLWQTWRILIPLTTTIVDVQTRQALIYLSNFIYIIFLSLNKSNFHKKNYGINLKIVQKWKLIGNPFPSMKIGVSWWGNYFYLIILLGQDMFIINSQLWNQY